MTRSVFEKQLGEVQEDMLVMAGMVQEAIAQSIEALKTRDVESARRIIANDVAINDKRYEAEEKCIELISLQAPLASDLRTIIAVLHITVDLERMGDHAEGIARIVLMLADEAPLKPYIDIPRMAQIAIEMMEGALEAYKQRDTALARRIIDRDDEVDELYDQLYRELLMFMIDERGTIQRATYLIWVAHNLERIADRVTNICERVVYLVEGKIHDLNVSKYWRRARSGGEALASRIAGGLGGEAQAPQPAQAAEEGRDYRAYGHLQQIGYLLARELSIEG